jgi:23S rRNA pseudoU1915 N3-methylase RlmH
LKAGTGKDTVEEITNVFTDFYTKQGVDIPQQPKYNKQDIEVLARHEADEIISQGFEEVIEEAERLNNLGVANMSEREKVIFPILAEYVKNTEQSTELEKIGVTKDVYTSQEFKDFAKKFNPNTPITEIFNIYNSTKPKKQTERIGSMKTTEVQDNGVKDFYTYEESLKYTKEDFDKNPKLWEAMLKSMQQWK